MTVRPSRSPLPARPALRWLAATSVVLMGATGCSSASQGASEPPSAVADDDSGAPSLPSPTPTTDDAGTSPPDDASAPPASGDASTPRGDAGTDGSTSPGDASTDAPHPVSTGLHTVMGTGGSPGHIVDANGKVFQLHGVDRSGTEYSCLNGTFFDGPADQTALDAMKKWNVNAVRVPLNEDCWLGINGVPSASGGTSYQTAIEGWVNLITGNGMVAILDLHWTAAGTTLANAQTPMPDADHSPTVWSQIAKTFASNGSVIFDLFNEPFITDWGCWVNGGMCTQSGAPTYKVAGMASLLQAVRNAGAQNVVILGGLGYSSDMSQWVSSVNGIPHLAAPLDGISIANVAASWHAYDFNGQSGCPSQYNGYMASLTCDSAATTAMNTSATSVLAAGFPLVIGEAGISAYSTSSAASFSSTQVSELQTWLDNLLTWADGEGQGYLGWSWNTDTPPLLITDYDGTPSPDFGVTYQSHLKKF